MLQNSSVHTLTTVNNSTYGDTGLPVISSEIIIEGNNSTIERDSGADPFRIFAVSIAGSLTLKETTVSGGAAVENCVSFINCLGGGVFNSFGSLTIQNSTLSGNSASSYGGGVFNYGTLTITDSTLSGNSASVAEGGGMYNGIGFFGDVGTLTITNSTLSGNAANVGSGVYNYGTLTITNSTLSGNTAVNRSGGVFNRGTLTISNSTLSGNSAGNEGGGMLNAGTLTFIRTLVSGNTATAGPEIYNFSAGTVTANNYNLFGFDNDARVVGFSPGATDVVPGAGILLSDILDPTLANNGGPTQTHALVEDSPALDASPDDSDCLPTDQRGVSRPQGLACDIGAFELGASACTEACVLPQALHVNAANDPLSGTSGDDILCGDERNNVLKGKRGHDLLCGFEGNDRLKGDGGNDTLDGGLGTDKLNGGSGTNTCINGEVNLHCT